MGVVVVVVTRMVGLDDVDPSAFFADRGSTVAQVVGCLLAGIGAFLTASTEESS